MGAEFRQTTVSYTVPDHDALTQITPGTDLHPDDVSAELREVVRVAVAGHYAEHPERFACEPDVG